MYWGFPKVSTLGVNFGMYNVNLTKVLFSTVDLQIRSQGQLFRHKMISKETEPKTCTALFTPTGT